MAAVSFVLHPRVDPEDPDVTAARRRLEREGKSVEVVIRHPPPQSPRVLDLDDAELVVSFGGDGTFLYAARAALKVGKPVLGVNLGRLGFLTWIDLHHAEAAVDAWLGGQAEIEERPVLDVCVRDRHAPAINEMALLKDPAANVIEVTILVDGILAGAFHADGALLATATGSTGYTLSAGGPLLDPRMHAMVFATLNAHNLATRPLVVPGTSEVQLSVDEATRLIVDGTDEIPLQPHDSVTGKLGGPPLRVLRAPGTADFYQQLRDKLRWGMPLVQERLR